MDKVKETTTLKVTFLFIVIAYIFNIGLRYIYVEEIGSVTQFLYNGHLMLNTNDGYYWIEGARDILHGTHQINDLSPIDSLIARFIAFTSKLFSFIDFDILIFYLPGFVSSLIVIPLVLIGRLAGSTFVGFLAALMAGIVWSLYHRTMFGYLDTDMLTVTLPTFFIWSVLFAFSSNNIKFFIITPVLELLMVSWHGGLINIAHGVLIMSIIYTYIYKKGNYDYIFFLLLLFIPLLPIAAILKIFLFIGTSIAYVRFFKEYAIESTNKRLYLFSLFGFIALYLIVIGFGYIANVLNNAYFSRDIQTTADTLHYFSVVNTVREAGHISYDTIVHRMSGSWPAFIVGVVGYIVFLVRFPLLMISLPLMVLGFFAIQGGLRFTVFAVPTLALGNAYAAYFVASLLHKKQAVIYGISLAIMSVFIYPNYQHIKSYIVPTVFTNKEVKVLEKLKTIASREDYVVTWWDYGYPIRYYADVKTLIDGGKHNGDVNYPVSYILTRAQQAAYNMAILDVYQTEYNYKNKLNTDYLKNMMQNYNLNNSSELLNLIASNKIKLPKVKEDIYLFLPNRMLDILPTVALFSNVDLQTGKIAHRPFFYQAKRFSETPQTIELGNGIRILKQNMIVQIGKNRAPIHKFTTVMYDKNGILHRQEKVIHPTSNVNVIYMPNFNRILVLNDELYNSTYIQLYVLENYDRDLFEPVILTPLVKVFKVKK